MLYRKLPMTIEAHVWDGSVECIKMLEEWSKHFIFWNDSTNALQCRTAEGTVTASLGDYCIKGVNGEFYFCKPDIFEKSYESVGDMDFSTALKLCKTGKKIKRKVWYDTLHVFYNPVAKNKLGEFAPTLMIENGSTMARIWTPLMMDIMAEDWTIYE